ncbi:MAG: hypothetical protein JNL01_10960 [Bdellovibrionales bacterium]|nr:hypothetical protein [Bdellovibrionales bacterium]
MAKNQLVFLIVAAAFPMSALAQTQPSEADLKSWIGNAEWRIARDEKTVAKCGNAKTKECKDAKARLDVDYPKLARHKATYDRLYGVSTVSRDLTAAEVVDTFKGFDLVREGNNYRVYGVSFKACDAKFKLVQSTSPGTGTNGKAYHGVRVVDLGGGLACVKEQKDKIAACGANLNVTQACSFGTETYSQLNDAAREGNLISLNENALINLGIESVDPAQPANAARFHDIPGRGEIVHVGSKIIETRDHENYVKALNKQFKECRKNVDEMKVALEALTILKDLNEFKGNLEEEVKKAHKDLLAAYAKKINDMDSGELDALREELEELRMKSPEGLTGNDFAVVFQKIAQQYQKDKALGNDAYAKSIETIRQAQGFDGVSDANKLRFENNITEIQMNELLAIASDGVSDRSVYREKRNEVLDRLQDLRKDSCNSKTGSLEACMTAKQAIQTVRYKIPQQAQYVRQQRQIEEYNRRLEEWRELQGGYMMNMGGGMDFGGGLDFGGGYGQSPMFTNNGPQNPGAVTFNSGWRPTQAQGQSFYNPSTTPSALWSGGNYGINTTVPLTNGGPQFVM